MNRNIQKLTETERHGQKRKKTDQNRQKQKEKVTNGQTRSETEKRTETLKYQVSGERCKVLSVRCQVSGIRCIQMYTNAKSNNTRRSSPVDNRTFTN